MINYRLKINFQDTKTLTSDICFVSGDVGAYKFVFDFFDSGKKVDVSDCVLTVRAKRADGKIIEGAGEITDGVAVFVPKNSMYSVPGELYMEIALTTKEKKYITTKIITASVIEGLGNKTVVSNDEVSVFVTLLNQVQGRIEEVNRLVREGLPVRGVDYWTPEDRTEMADDVAEDVSPEIHDGEWWVYDSTTKSMAPSGIKAEGVDGYTPQKGVDYFDGEQGIKGDKGDTGADGYSPVKGVDYYTEEEKTEFINEVSKDSSAKYANALKGSVSGYSVRVDDVSPVEHNLEVKLASKNVLKINDASNTTNGIVCSVSNGVVTLSGTNASTGIAYIALAYNNIPMKKGTYILSGWNSEWGGGQYISATIDGVYRKFGEDTGAGAVFTISKDCKVNLTAFIPSGATVDITYTPQVELGTTASAYTPYVDVSTVTVKKYKKNLVGINSISGIGVGSYKIEGDKIYLEPTETGSIYGVRIGVENLLRIGGTYTVTVKDVSGFDSSAWGWRVNYADGTTGNLSYSKKTVITVKKPITALNFYSGMAYTGGSVTLTGIQIEIGNNQTDYAEYEEAETYSVLSDGTVKEIKSIAPDMTLTTDTDGVILECEYNRDTNKVIEKLTNAIISLGGNV